MKKYFKVLAVILAIAGISNSLMGVRPYMGVFTNNFGKVAGGYEAEIYLNTPGGTLMRLTTVTRDSENGPYHGRTVGISMDNYKKKFDIELEDQQQLAELYANFEESYQRQQSGYKTPIRE